MRDRSFDAASRATPAYQLYVRFDPTVNGNGGGGAGNGGADSATVDTLDRPPGARRLRPGHGDERGQPRLRAAGLRRARRRRSREAASGFAGAASDGLVQLDATHALDPTYADATDGNVVQTARVALEHDGKAVLALGFGATQAEAVGAAEGSLGARLRQVARTTTGRAGSSTTRR